MVQYRRKENVMLKVKFILPVLLATAFMLILTGCYRKTPEQRAEEMVQHIVKTLQLDNAQTIKLEKIKDEFLARRPEMSGVREDTVKEANEMMRSSQINQSQLDALLARNQKVVDDYVHFVAAKFTEIHDMLTPEQREKLVSTIENYMGAGRHY
jgi:Spy/CpxP family protein refolding chaperone